MSKHEQTHVKVLSVNHWNPSLVSFTTERPQSFNFRTGEFTEIGLPGPDEKPIMRAFSIASAPLADELEFLSIIMPDSNDPAKPRLTHRFTNLAAGDAILLQSLSKPGKNHQAGSLVLENLTPGESPKKTKLFLIGTGTGLAPWMSVIRDHEFYQNFGHIYLCHGVRHAEDLAYRDYLEKGIHEDPFMQALFEHGGIEGSVSERLTYYPTATKDILRDDKPDERITTQIRSGELFRQLGLDQTQFNPATDRVLVCGSHGLNMDMIDIAKEHGLARATHRNHGELAVEDAFVERDKKPTTQVSSASIPDPSKDKPSSGRAA